MKTARDLLSQCGEANYTPNIGQGVAARAAAKQLPKDTTSIANELKDAVNAAIKTVAAKHGAKPDLAKSSEISTYNGINGLEISVSGSIYWEQ